MTTVESGRTDRTHEPLTDQFLGVELSVDDANRLYAELRARGRMLWNASQGFWVAPHHAEVMTVSTDPDTYCSGKGILTFEIGAEYATPPTMMHTDPPDHTRYRSLVQPAFGRRVVKTLDDSVRDAARVLVDALPLDEPVDIVPPLAVPLPVQVIAQLLGLPEAQWDRVWEWSEASA
jgi:cytochrome P450